MRRLFACAVATVAAAAILSPAVAGASPRIVGGGPIPITAAPWQALVHHTETIRGQLTGFLCGGSIIDATHVVTAAHCVLPRDGQDPTAAPVATSSFTVTVGTAHVSDLFSNPRGAGADATAVTVGVASIAKDPRYNGDDFDTAVVTLSSAIPLDGVARKAIPLGISTPATGAPLTVSGWGDTTSSGQPSNDLRATTVNAVDFATCNAAYSGVYTAASVICAIAPGSDSCFGDSGGPLVDAGGNLVGIVSSGPIDHCADVNQPGVYTNVTDCRVRAFITSQINGPGPQVCGPPGLSGNAGPPGQVLTCSPGTWSGSPTFSFAFVDQASGTILQSGPSTAYTLALSDIGRHIVCRVTATDSTGSQSALSPAVGPIAPPPDTAAPTAHFEDAVCTRTQCILHITVSDPEYSSGIRSVKVTRRTTVSKRCVVRGRRKTCHKNTYATLTTRRLADGRFKVTASHLPKAVTRFSARATDNKGNVQRNATFVRRHTPPL
jgi:secreted trypsin-like serine protease